MARRKPRRKARRNSGVKPWVKVMVTGYVGPGWIDSGWNTLPVYVWDPSGEASEGDVRRAVRRTLEDLPDLGEFSIGEVSRTARRLVTMWPQHTVDLKGEWYDWKPAKKNPRRGLAAAVRSPAANLAIARVGISPSTTHNLFTAGPALRATGSYPSGEPIGAYQREVGGGTNIFQATPSVGPFLPGTDLPALYREEPGQRELPGIQPPAQQRLVPPAGGTLPGPGYIRTSLASQPGSPTTDAKLYKQLLDPQLWSLADGGDRWAMHELHRRGPAHYLPARPNPDWAWGREGEEGWTPPDPTAGWTATRLKKGVWKVSGELKKGDGIRHYQVSAPTGRKAIKIALEDSRVNPPPIFPPAKAKSNTKKKGMSQKVASFFKHGGEQERAYHRRESSERRAEVLAEDRRLAARARRKREKDKLVGSTGMTEAQLRRLLKKNPNLAALVGGGRGLRLRDLTEDKQLFSYGSGPRGGYSLAERKALPACWFLKPRTRGWPVADERHVEIALQYMTAGRGRPVEYPKLVKRMAKLWPVAEYPHLWKIYTRNRAKIQRKHNGPMPTLAQLRKVQ